MPVERDIETVCRGTANEPIWEDKVTGEDLTDLVEALKAHPSFQPAITGMQAPRIKVTTPE